MKVRVRGPCGSLGSAVKVNRLSGALSPSFDFLSGRRKSQPQHQPRCASRLHSYRAFRMSSSQRQAYHQDYIARIRYSNALPPPPCPPKLLDIPNTGLSSGQYTSAAFASRLVREQPLNIEADAELGMPIDLVGIPGVFDGDESGKALRSLMKDTWL